MSSHRDHGIPKHAGVWDWEEFEGNAEGGDAVSTTSTAKTNNTLNNTASTTTCPQFICPVDFVPKSALATQDIIYV